MLKVYWKSVSIDRGVFMIKIKPKFVYDEKNKKRGVILTPKQFGKLIEVLEDFDDYWCARSIKPYKLEDCTPFEQVVAELVRCKK